METRWTYAVVVALAVLAPALAADPFGAKQDEGPEEDETALPTGVLPATARRIFPASATRSWAATDGDGVPLGARSWRVFNVGGNCCEHYLATSQDGWVMNLGGAYPTWSPDGGSTWWQASPQMVLVGAEGGIVAAPGGDVVAMTWDPYTGDQVVAYRYSAAAGAWHWNVVNLKTPFFDRPWIGIAPGPFDVGGVTVPYVSFIQGGLIKAPLYMSLDGLHYTAIDPGHTAATRLDVRSDLPDTGVDAPVDHLQGHQQAAGVPLPRGGWLGPMVHVKDEAGPHAALLTEDLRWVAYDGPVPTGNTFIDSSGAIHQVTEVDGSSIRHRLSTDGGATWRSYDHTRPGAYVSEWDFKTNGALGLAVLLVRWDSSSAYDQDIVYKMWDYATDLAPDEVLQVGDGDIDTRSGLFNDPRYDFATVGILPDGRVVASFADRSYRPGFAIEVPGAGLLGNAHLLAP